MRLVRYGEPGQERPGLIDNTGKIRDLSGVVGDISGYILGNEKLASLLRLAPDNLPVVDQGVRLGPCVAGVGKIVGVAMNYKKHAAEMGDKQLPVEPILFLKATSSISGPYDEIVLPGGSEKTDWEVELGIVMGERAKNVSVSDALSCIAGYCVVNDVSERGFQFERGGTQHSKGKSADTFCPIGPWLVTRDEIPDPQGLDLWTEVNGVRMQDSSTSDMIFNVAKLVSYISEFMTLLPGDIIISGTPGGVGRGRKPQVFLKAGDVVALGVAGLGEQKHGVVQG